MTDYTLKYYKINGRVSGLKYFMDYLNLPFKNVDLEFKEFQASKEDSPIHKSPLLIDNKNDFILPGVIAIYHYLSTKHGCLPKSLYDQAVCDAFAGLVEEFMFRMNCLNEAIFHDGPFSDIQELHDFAMKFLCQNLIPILARQLRKNETGFLIGDEITWVDFMVASATSNINICEVPDLSRNHVKWTETVDKNELEIVVNHQCKIFGMVNNYEKIVERHRNDPKKEK